MLDYRSALALAAVASLYGVWLSVRLMRGRPPEVVAPLGLSPRALVGFAAVLQAPLIVLVVGGLASGALPALLTAR